MAIGTTYQSAEFSQLAQQLYDPVSRELMIDAVTLDCGHTVSQKTAELYIQKKVCPVDHSHEVSIFVPNLSIRIIVQLFLDAPPALNPFIPKSLVNNAETIEKLRSTIDDISSELRATREELKRMREVSQHFERESEKKQAREQAFQMTEQAKERFALHLPLHSLEIEVLKRYFGAEFQESGLYTDIAKILLWPCPVWPDKASLSGLVEVMQQCPNLTTLSLAWCRHLEDEDLQAITLCCPNQETNQSWKMSQLRHLDLSNCPGVTDAGLAIIGQNCPNLQGLNLNGCSHITDNGTQVLTYNIGGSPNFKQLQTLSLSGTKITDQSIGYIIRFCRDVQSLNLSHCESVTDKGIVSIARSILRDHLHTLNLHGCNQLTDVAITEIAQNCTALQTLVWTNGEVIKEPKKYVELKANMIELNHDATAHLQHLLTQLRIDREIIAYLIQFGAQLNQRISGPIWNGGTPAHLIAGCSRVDSGKRIEILKLFRDYHLNFRILDHEARTALEVARTHNSSGRNQPVVDFLEEIAKEQLLLNAQEK